MSNIICDNVCTALPLGMDYLIQNGVAEHSRAGTVLACKHPIITEYIKPWQRVLFNPVRDANPFFHLAEAMWMLAGRNDAEYINQFVHDFGLRFADDGIMWGSYGYRWRHRFGYDQLSTIVDRLRDDPKDRRIVLSMWDPVQDFLNPEKKDIPCNTQAYFRIVDNKLQMTVCCRSNDIIWGAYGANAVHFSFLQEYIAAWLGVELGSYFQISNNYHAYTSEIDKLKRKSKGDDLFFTLQDNRYRDKKMILAPLVDDPSTFDKELSACLEDPKHAIKMNNKFIVNTLSPILLAHRAYKAGQAWEPWLDIVCADDWRVACQEWIQRRTEKKTSQMTLAEVDR